MTFIKGYQMSEEHKRKIGLANKGKVHTKEQNLAHSKAMTGQKRSAETKAKMSKARIGKKHSAEARKKMSEVAMGKPGTNTGKYGPLSPRWQGGKTPIARLERFRKAGRVWKTSVFKRDDYTCQLCSQKGGELHADHIKTFADYPELKYDVDNGRTLCRKCHYFVTYGRIMPITSKWGITKGRKLIIE